jgi:hypothetical protein
MTNRGRRCQTVEMNAEAYFADPIAAARLAEIQGRVVVMDPAGEPRLVLNSHRASERLLKR